MKIFICASKHFYDKVEAIKHDLEQAGHVITLPNSFDDPGKENTVRALGEKEHSKWKSDMIREQEVKVRANDAILVLNFEKHGQKNYIGGAVFLEMFKAFELNKPIYLYNPVPKNILEDEIRGFEPIIISQDLSLIK